MSMDELKQRVGLLKKKLDTNGDGLINGKELLSPTALKMIAVTIISILFPELINSVVSSIAEGSIVWNGVADVVELVAVPFLMIYFFKSIVDDYDGRLRTAQLQLQQAEQKLTTMEAEHRLAMQNADNRYELLEQQMKYQQMLKDNEIERLRQSSS